MRNDLGAAPLLFKGTPGQVRGPHVLLRAVRDVKVVKRGFGIVHQTAAGFGKVPLVAVDNELAAPFNLRHRGRIAHVGH
jgi:hypothetical protein